MILIAKNKDIFNISMNYFIKKQGFVLMQLTDECRLLAVSTMQVCRQRVVMLLVVIEF